MEKVQSVGGDQVTTTEIIQGDMFKLLPEMGKNSFDYIFTSPPYNRKRNDKYEYYDDAIDYAKIYNKVKISKKIRDFVQGYWFFNWYYATIYMIKIKYLKGRYKNGIII